MITETAVGYIRAKTRGGHDSAVSTVVETSIKRYHFVIGVVKKYDEHYHVIGDTGKLSLSIGVTNKQTGMKEIDRFNAETFNSASQIDAYILANFQIPRSRLRWEA